MQSPTDQKRCDRKDLTDEYSGTSCADGKLLVFKKEASVGALVTAAYATDVHNGHPSSVMFIIVLQFARPLGLTYGLLNL